MLCVFVLGLVTADPLFWEDRVNDLVFDWSALQRPYYDPWVFTYSDSFLFNTKYVFNFGANIPEVCGAQNAAAIEVVEILADTFEECDILGRHEMHSFSVLDSEYPQLGFQITYSGGDLCIERSSATKQGITFVLECSQTEGPWEVIESSLDYCHVFLSKKTQAGCGFKNSKSIGLVWWLVVGLVAGAFVYLALGILYNLYRGKRGNEVIPNYYFWTRLTYEKL